MNLRTRIKNAFNVFRGRPPDDYYSSSYQTAYYGGSSKPDRTILSTGISKSTVNSIYTKIAVDVSTIDIKHVRLNEDDEFQEVMDSTLNYVLTKSANLDQTGRGLIRDAVLTIFDEGCAALVPIDWESKAKGGFDDSECYDILSLRVCKIKQWYPDRIRVSAYDENTGKHREVTVLKRRCAIIENPFYSIMNEPNSTAKRLIALLNQIDRQNQESSSGKFNMIIQFPFSLRNQARQDQAKERLGEVENQLVNSPHGIAYIDATEKVIQLNRSLDNTLVEQAVKLKQDLYNELGFSDAIFNGTADEKTLLNYYNRTIEPILNEIVEEMERKWLSPTAITQRQGIRYFRSPFKIVPVSELAEIFDKFGRNEIVTSNECRSIIGMKPSDDERANQLINSNNLKDPQLRDSSNKDPFESMQ